MGVYFKIQESEGAFRSFEVGVYFQILESKGRSFEVGVYFKI